LFYPTGYTNNTNHTKKCAEQFTMRAIRVLVSEQYALR